MQRFFLIVAATGLLFGAPARAEDAKDKILEDKILIFVMETTMGTVKIELFPNEAPVTVRNFLNHVNDHFYDGTILHYVDRSFVFGGVYAPGMKGNKISASILNESANGLSNGPGTIAMARLGKDSHDSFFLFNLGDNKHLDKINAQDGIGFCVFGQVIEGNDVLEKIKNVKTSQVGEFKNVPVQDVIVSRVYLQGWRSVPGPSRSRSADTTAVQGDTKAGSDDRWIGVVGLLALLLLLGLAVPTLYFLFNNPEKEELKHGQEALNAGDNDLAIAHLKAATRLRRKSQAVSLLGVAYHRKKDYSEALSLHDEAIELNQNDYLFYLRRGDTYLETERFQNAIEDYSDALRLNPDCSQAKNQRALAYDRQKDFQASGRANQTIDMPRPTSNLLANMPQPTSNLLANMPIPERAPLPNPKSIDVAKSFNPMAVTGFVLGLASMVLYAIGLFPILGIVFSGIGLATFKEETQKAKWMAGVGLGLSILYTFMFFSRQ